MKQKNSPAENEIIAAEEAEDSSKGGEAFQGSGGVEKELFILILRMRKSSNTATSIL